MSDRDALFGELRAILLEHGGGFVITKDEPGDLVIRTNEMDAKGERGWFAMLAAKKAKIVLHIMPLYDNAALEALVTPVLEARRHGKTCFNFTCSDADQVAAVAKQAKAAAKTVAGKSH